MRSNLLVFRSGDKKRTKEAQSRANFPELSSKEMEGLGYVAYASDRQDATSFISRSSLPAKLDRIGSIEAVELDRLSSLVRTVSRLDPPKLGELCDFISGLGRAL